jgi:hypothetical protein
LAPVEPFEVAGGYLPATNLAETCYLPIVFADGRSAARTQSSNPIGAALDLTS